MRAEMHTEMPFSTILESITRRFVGLLICKVPSSNPGPELNFSFVGSSQSSSRPGNYILVVANHGNADHSAALTDGRGVLSQAPPFFLSFSSLF